MDYLSEVVISPDTWRPRTTPQLRLEVRVEPGATGIRLLRGLVRSMLRDRGVSQEHVDAVILGLDEVLMNACVHGNSSNGEGAKGDCAVDVFFELFREGLQVEVCDRGECSRLAGLDGKLPDLESESGRGMFLIRKTMDEVSFFAREGGGTRVRLVKRF